MSDEIEKFRKECDANISEMAADEDFERVNQQWLEHSIAHKYSYNFNWMGRPIIQYPQDIVAMQELIWELRPDFIIETGIAHGGSLIFYASMLELLGGEREILGIDIDIRAHNRAEIEKHPMSHRIKLMQGSSIDEELVASVAAQASQHSNVMVLLDSNHTHEHVLKELELYAPLVSSGSYLVVFDTIVDDLPDSLVGDRPWSNAANPKTAVNEFLKSNKDFSIDARIHDKLKITVASGGYLKRA
jgi:cephalosporin hydroxylase